MLVAGSAIAVVRTRGYDVSDERRASLVVLAPWQLVVFEHIAARIAASDDPNDKSIPSAYDVDVAGFVDRYCVGMHALLRRDLLRLLGFMEHMAPLAIGKNDQGLMRGAFASIKALVFMGYYRDPRTWKMLGYAGPFVKRPVGGWQ